MSDKIEKILNSIKGIKPAEVKPYFYTRLSSKLDTVQNNEAFYLKYERPFLIMLVAIMMALLKIARTQAGEDNDDNYIDGCGYIGIAGELMDRDK